MMRPFNRSFDGVKRWITQRKQDPTFDNPLKRMKPIDMSTKPKLPLRNFMITDNTSNIKHNLLTVPTDIKWQRLRAMNELVGVSGYHIL
jgi:hypothetical protein